MLFFGCLREQPSIAEADPLSSSATDTIPPDSSFTASTASGTDTHTHIIPPQLRPVCIFDYDLTLSSHACKQIEGDAAYFCRETGCPTYGWTTQCLAMNAREVVAECVNRGAYIGIASHADADDCWHDKVTPIITEQQFPEWTALMSGAANETVYPLIDDRSNWNCDNCAYNMDGSIGKPEGIRRVMRHFGLDPTLPSDLARVVFWDDMLSNITAVQEELPQVNAVHVPNFTGNGGDGGCGITRTEIYAGFSM